MGQRGTRKTFCFSTQILVRNKGTKQTQALSYPNQVNGSLKGWESLPNPLQYLPLDHATDEVRLINLMGAKDPTDPLVAEFAYTPMNDETVYHALSYVWGQENASHEILLNGQTFLIRKYLDTCLRAIRATDSRIVVCVDAICIDHNNIPSIIDNSQEA
jgi:hypothetical protein